MRHPEPDWPRTLDEFRVWHERQPDVWEFIEGWPVMMAPGSKAHTLIKSNLTGEMRNALRGTACTVLTDGAIVEVGNSSLIPDLVVTCAPLDFSTPRVDEPLIVVEILSPSGERDDLGRKLGLYMQVPSLSHYLVVSQDAARLLHHARQSDDRFLTSSVTGTVDLDPPGIRLDLTAVFEGVPLAQS